MSKQLHPSEIRYLFEKNWTGSDDELEQALESFLDDILDSIRLSDGEDSEIAETVSSYVEANYF